MAVYYKLDKVKAIADNDQEFINVLVQTFLEEIPEDANLLKEAIENDNKEQAYQMAHKMKPTMELFGLEYFNSLLALQDWGRNSTKLEDVFVQMTQVLNSINNASKELKKDFNL